MGRRRVNPSDYLGLTNYNAKGDLMKIVEVYTYANIVVEFQDDFHYRANCSIGAFKKGLVTNFF